MLNHKLYTKKGKLFIGEITIWQIIERRMWMTLLVICFIASVACNIYFWICAMEGYEWVSLTRRGSFVYDVQLMDEYCTYEWNAKS